MAKRPLTKITLYENVPFDKTYKHVVNWDNQAELDNYLDGFFHVSELTSFQSISKPIRWDTLKQYTASDGSEYQVNINNLSYFNYVKLEITTRDGGKTNFYCFITDIEYYNDGTSFIYFSIDNWNTFNNRIQWNSTRANIKRGFVNELNPERTDFSRQFYRIMNNSDDEIGGDGCTLLQDDNTIKFNINPDGQTRYGDDVVKFIVFVAQPQDAKTESGTYLATYSQYLYYFIAYNPISNMLYNVSCNGQMISQHSDTSLPDVYKDLATAGTFVGTDSLVVDSELFNYIGIPFSVDLDNKTVYFDTDNPDSTLEMTEKDTYLVQLLRAGYDVFKPSFGEVNLATDNHFPAVYDGRNPFVQLCDWAFRTWGPDCPLMILSQPFSKLVFTDGKGTMIDTDLFKFNNLTQPMYMMRWGSISENGHETVALNGYNNNNPTEAHRFVNHENAYAVDNSARDLPIVLDNYTMYLNANRNQLANVRANAKMNLQLARMGAQTVLGNTMRTLDNNANVTAVENANRAGVASFKTKSGTAMGALNGVMSGASGGIGGAIIGGLTGGATAYANGRINEHVTAMNNATASQVTAMNNATQAQNARDNFAYANAVATNNYEQTIRTQNAQLADVKNHNDQVAHEGSNYLVDAQLNNWAWRWQFYTCQPSVMRNVILYFSLFGYVINELDYVDNWLHVKQTFNYVKTTDCRVSGNMPEPARDTLEVMFDNGVTVWSPSHLIEFGERNQTVNHFTY